MSGYYGNYSYNKYSKYNYPYSHNQLSADNPFRFIGANISSNEQKKPNIPQYSVKTAPDPQKLQNTYPYERKLNNYNENNNNSYNKPLSRADSRSSLINSSYNIINNIPYSQSKSQKYNNYSLLPQQRDHVGELFNYTIRELPFFSSSNTNNNINNNNNNSNINEQNMNNSLNQTLNPYSSIKGSRTPQKDNYQNNTSTIPKINNIEDKIKNINDFTSAQNDNINKETKKDRFFSPQHYNVNYNNINSNINNNNYNYNNYNNNNSGNIYSKYNNESKNYELNSINNNDNFSIKNSYTEEKLSNIELSEYSEENCNSIKSYAYKENPNSRFRDYMEDKGRAIQNIKGDPNSSLFCLFDGHGGDQVSKFLQQNFYQYFKEALPFNNVRDSLVSLFNNIDSKIKEKDFFNVGATACIIYITKENGQRCLYSANIGDTRSVLISSNEYRRLSYDHRASDPNENERITKEGGIVFCGRVYGVLMLSRAFGDWELKPYGVLNVPHITRTNITNNDLYVVMASDGVWDVFEDIDIYEMSKGINNSKELCNNIVQRTIEKGSTDNISCFVIKLN